MGKLGAAVILALAGQGAFGACAPGSVELRSPTGAAMRFSVELADTEAERATGLMNRDKMATAAGMLFVYEAPHHVYFWMKDTLIPLDMVFADARGQVTSVHSGAVPMDETPIDGGAGVSYVLEINGGLAARLGLDAGAMMRSDLIDQAQAVWPCSAD
jgi:uncharacterized membrane protein (UPF0127 family)